MMIDKLRAALTDWMAVSDADVEREYQQRNEKVKLQVVALTADAFRDKVTVTDADVAVLLRAHKAEYRVGEQRKVRMLLLDRDQARREGRGDRRPRCSATTTTTSRSTRRPSRSAPATSC